MPYRTTQEANEDIYAIYVQGVMQFGADQAANYINEIFDTFEVISKFPLIARERFEYVPAYRVHPHNVHSIFYLVEDDDVLIVRVLHASRDWRRHL